MSVNGFSDSEELIEGELLEAESRRDVVIRRVGELTPVARTAAVATVGAVVGAATAVVVAKASSARPAGRLGGRRSDLRTETIEATTSYLIDIHRLVRQ